MTQYKYGTLLRVTSAPDGTLEEGTMTVEAGKHPDGMEEKVFTDDDELATIEMETVEVYDADRRMSEKRILDFVQQKAAEQEAV